MAPDGKRTDVIVVGAGIVGAATALELSRRKFGVLLVDRFEPGHARGSSHGSNRIFRLAYQDPLYVRLATEALEDWIRLESEAGESFLERTGGVYLGEGAERCAEAMTEAGVPHERLDRADASTYGLDLPSKTVIWQRETAVIAAERSVQRTLDLASSFGAEISWGTRFLGVSEDLDGLKVDMDGSEVFCSSLVLACGPWNTHLARTHGFDLDAVVTREQVAYLEPSPEIPVVVDWDDPVTYLVPRHHGADGIKVGLHHHGQPVDPEDGPFAPTDDGIEIARTWLAGLISQDVSVVSTETCLYTTTPNEDFFISKRGRVVMVSACSGHGFKFGPRIGRAVADIAEERDPGLPRAFLA